MKVLVTGGCGFLGSHVCEYYKNNGDDVVSIDNLTKYEFIRAGYNVDNLRMYNLKFLKSIRVNNIKEDICNKDMLLKAASSCDFIVHTAAQPSMTISIENPELDINSNVVGTFNVLEASRKYDIPVVNCSSIHVYGNKINEKLKEGSTRFVLRPSTIDENYPTLRGEITPLHASKMSAEFYVQSFIDTYKLKAATFRFTGMYGTRQFGNEDHGWVANFSIRTILGLPINIFGTDKQVRDILYASDAATAFDAFYKRQIPGTYNVGGGIKNMISIKEYFDILEEIVGKKSDIKMREKRKGDLWYFVCNIEKIKKKLGWEPKISNREGLNNLIRWIQENKNLFGV